MPSDDANSSSPPLPRQPPPPPPKPKLSDRFLAGIVEEKSFALPIIPPINTMKAAMTSNSALVENNNLNSVSNNIETIEEAPVDVDIIEKGKENSNNDEDDANEATRSSPPTMMNIETSVDCDDGNTDDDRSGKQPQQQQQSNNNNMSKQQPPRYSDRNYTDGPIDDTYYNKLPHWSQQIAVIENVSITDCLIAGGSDYGQLSYFTETGDIILEINDIKVAGLTGADVEDILSAGLRHNFKIITGQHSLPIELREYLSRSFARGSVDHKLQELIRENIYARTVPCTTRSAKPGEVDGIDYYFLSRDKFLEMDKAGLLLESGVYCNHYYGTPFPSIKNNNKDNIKAENGNNENSNLNKQDKEQSKVETNLNSSNGIENGGNNNASISGHQQQQQTNGTKTSEGMTSLQRRQRNRSNLTAIETSTLPYGWERIADAHYGVYYIDHINKRTQYERPYEVELVKQSNGFGFTLIELDRGLVVVKTLIQGGAAQQSGVIQAGDVLVSVAGVSVAGLQHAEIALLFLRFEVGDRVRLTFARGYQLPNGFTDEDYDIITLKIIKGQQGFGFTISEGQNGQKVKKILDHDRCAALRQGDILLSINGYDLTPLSHLDVVEVLKQCPLEDPTEFMIKRKKRSQTKSSQQQQHSLANVTTDSNADSASTMAANEMYLDSGIMANNSNINNGGNSHGVNGNGMYQKAPPMEVFYQNQAQVAQAQAQIAAEAAAAAMAADNLKNVPESINFNGNMFDTSTGGSENFYINQEAENIYRINTQQQLQPRTTASVISSPDFGQYNLEAATSGFYSAANLDTLNTFNNMIKSQSAPMIPNMSGRPVSANDHNNGFNNNNKTHYALSASLLPPPPPISQLPPIFPLDVSSADVEFEYHQVTLGRSESGFGFRIIGGSEEGSNVAIGSIVPNSVAHLEGTLKPGDEIVSINETNVIGASHQEVVQLMASTGASVVLLVRRKRFLNAYDVSLYRTDLEGFGFVIISCGNCALIGRIIDGSPAQRCQRLHIRDRIVAVNGVDVTSMQHPEIVNKIKESGNTLNLRIIPADCYTVELMRGPQGYGFSIRGGAEYNGMPFFILALAANGPAAGLLNVGDEILEINDNPTIGLCHSEAVRAIAASQPTVKLRIRRNANSLNGFETNGTGVSGELVPGFVAVGSSASPKPSGVLLTRQSTPQHRPLSRPQQSSPQPSLLQQQSSSLLSYNNPNIVSY